MSSISQSLEAGVVSSVSKADSLAGHRVFDVIGTAARLADFLTMATADRYISAADFIGECSITVTVLAGFGLQQD